MYNSEAADDLKVKQAFYRRIFNTKYNLSFGTPRTDVCTTCLRFSEEMKVEKDYYYYCWTEESYPKAANEIASAVYHRLKNTDLSTITKVRLMADGCAGQNKNTNKLAMLSKWLTEAPQNVKEIEFIFPVVDHSYIRIEESGR